MISIYDIEIVSLGFLESDFFFAAETNENKIVTIQKVWRASKHQYSTSDDIIVAR